MPYTPKSARAYFDEHPLEAKDGGDITYLFYIRLLKIWTDRPRYATYFRLRMGSRDARYMPLEILNLVKGLANNDVEIPALSAAYDCALDELKRRYVDKYEDGKLAENGDVELPLEAVLVEPLPADVALPVDDAPVTAETGIVND